MLLSEYIDDIKLELTGGILELEIPDETIGKVVKKSLKEIQRYIDITKLITVPYADCIDMADFNCSSITKLYRTSGYGDDTSTSSLNDPMYAQRWMMYGAGGSMYNLQNYVLNFMSYNTLAQMENTVSTDLSFKWDSIEQKLYPNVASNRPKMITIEYVPRYAEPEDITDDYWRDILYRLSLASTKIMLGRIRSRYTQSGALWTQDGETMLNEGNEELNNLREILRTNSQLGYPIS